MEVKSAITGTAAILKLCDSIVLLKNHVTRTGTVKMSMSESCSAVTACYNFWMKGHKDLVEVWASRELWDINTWLQKVKVMRSTCYCCQSVSAFTTEYTVANMNMNFTWTSDLVIMLTLHSSNRLQRRHTQYHWLNIIFELSMSIVLTTWALSSLKWDSIVTSCLCSDVLIVNWFAWKHAAKI